VAFVLPRELQPFILPLIPWLLLFVISSIVGGIRRVYDTKVYTRMFADLSSSVVATQLHKGEDLSKIAGRSALAWQNIEFFQYNLPEFIEQIINVVGAISALAIFDWRLALVGAGLVLLVAASSRLYMSRVARIQAQLNDMHEQEYNTFATKDPKAIRKYYTDISSLEIKFSNMQAGGYGILRFLLLIMFLATLYISLDLDRFTIGELYSIVAYLWTFVTASEYIPYLSEKWVALKDVTGRIQSDEFEDEEEEA
jgi:ABC-type multidrug transport system fused ATPase/permease subunit